MLLGIVRDGVWREAEGEGWWCSEGCRLCGFVGKGCVCGRMQVCSMVVCVRACVAIGVLALAVCDATAAPSHGSKGNCTSTVASGSSCQPVCNTGYTVSGTSDCALGELTAATCSESGERCC